MPISTERRMTTYDLPWFWAYGNCGRHRAFSTRKEARAAGRHHALMVRHGARCERCSSGWEPQAFRCYEGGNHFHWGHAPSRGEP